MAKRAAGSRARRPPRDGAARASQERAESNARRANVLAQTANTDIARAATPGDVAETERAVEAATSAPDDGPPTDERAQHTQSVAEVNLAVAIRLLRQFIEQADDVEQPFTRVMGRIIFILTVDGGRGACTAGNIAAVLLLFLPEHLDPGHRQAGTTRQTIDVNETNLQGLLYDRLEKLRSRKWLNMVVYSTQNQGVLLSEDGRFVFNGWPEGIQFDPNSRDIWERKRPTITGRRRQQQQQHPAAPGRANPS